MDEKTVFTISPSFVITSVNGEDVVAPVSDSVVNLTEFLVLNATGSSVIDGVRRGMNLRTIVDSLAFAHKSVDRQLISADVVRFIEAMLQKGVLLRRND